MCAGAGAGAGACACARVRVCACACACECACAPDVPVAAARDIVEHDRGKLPPLAHARPVAQEESTARARGRAQVSAAGAGGGQDVQMALAAERDAFDLQARQLASGDQLRRQRVEQRICALRSWRGCERGCLGDVGRVSTACLRVCGLVLGEYLARCEADGVRLLSRTFGLLYLVGFNRRWSHGFCLASLVWANADALLGFRANEDDLQQGGRRGATSDAKLVPRRALDPLRLARCDVGAKLLEALRRDPEDPDRLGVRVLHEHQRHRTLGCLGGARVGGRAKVPASVYVQYQL